VTYHSKADEAALVVGEIEALGRKATALWLDVGNVSSFAAFSEQVRMTLQNSFERDSFDYLVNNAGHGDMAMIADTTEAQFDALVNVHFKGVFFLTQALLPLIGDGSRIINLSSGLTRISIPAFPPIPRSRALSKSCPFTWPRNSPAAASLSTRSHGRNRNRLSRRGGSRHA